MTGSYAEQGESLGLEMNLTGSNMPVTELQGLLPALGIVLPAGSSLKGGAASVSFAEGPADALVTMGSVALSNATLSGFDMGKKMSTIERLAGIRSGPDTQIQTLSANVRYAPEGASVQDLKLVLGGIGEVTGSGTISPQEALDFKMAATVHGSAIAAVMANAPIPFSIEGSASDPQFRPDVKGLAGATLKGFKGNAGKAAGGILKGILGGKKIPDSPPAEPVSSLIRSFGFHLGVARGPHPAEQRDQPQRSSQHNDRHQPVQQAHKKYRVDTSATGTGIAAGRPRGRSSSARPCAPPAPTR